MATYRLPFENVPGWTVGLGNFDDPGGGHGVGQAFAWDFKFPVDGGAKVLAARAGTVIDSRANATTVLPNGVDDLIKGPGNYVVVQHADRTIAAYDHMHPNTVKVSAGQYVDQGAWLGNVGKIGSTSGGIVHLHFECHTWLTVGSTGPASIVNDTMGPSLLVHLEDASHHAWRPVVGDALAPLAVVSRQDGWRCCVKCGGLYFSYWGVQNACPAGGVHDFAGSGDYALPNNAANPPGQAGWRQCVKCSGMFFSENAGSKCPVTTPTAHHDATASGAYSIVENAPNDSGQHRWRWCAKCQGMWFEDGWASICPADGNAHSLSGSGNYSIAVDPQDVQRNWRRCSRCQSLYLAANGPGVCQAGAGGHDPGASGSYMLPDEVTPVNAGGPQQQGWEGGWRYCKQCGQLWLGTQSGSHCPAGGSHSKSGSGEYWLNTGGKLGELDWRRCTKCQALWSGAPGSHCPQGGTHSSAGAYGLMVDTFVWHWCHKCQGLWLGNWSTGVCEAGGGHSLVGSADYFVVDDYDQMSTPGSPGTQPAGWQDGWRYCLKCELLWWSLGGASHCPAGGAHAAGVQDGKDQAHGNFVLDESGGSDRPGQQVGWRLCPKCQTLWMGANSGSKCAADGQAHTSTGSQHYRLQHGF
jgi:hypothetical protein